jgi:hypothetical protein
MAITPSLKASNRPLFMKNIPFVYDSRKVFQNQNFFAMGLLAGLLPGGDDVQKKIQQSNG